MSRRIKWLLPSGLLFLVSLFSPVFVFEEGNSGFLLGFVCLLFGFGKLAWYANPLHFAAVLTFLLGWFRWTAVLTLLAAGLALTTLTITEVPRNEGGQLTRIAGYHVGFYLWLGSMVVLFATAGWQFLGSRGRHPSPASVPSVTS